MKTVRSARPLLAAALLAASVAVPQAHAQQAAHPFVARSIPGQYIVSFDPRVADPRGQAQALVQAHGGRLRHAYSHALKGFSANLPEQAVQALRNHPLVALIEQDQVVSLRQLVSPQGQATWGLDRVDQPALPLDSQYSFTHSGSRVYTFIIDSGVRSTHAEFAGRMAAGFTAVNDGYGAEDCNGHGTHVAGTVAGTTWGVAKQATIVPVRVLDCSGSGSWSSVIAGIDHVANSPLRPAVGNLSLGGGYSQIVNSAVAGAVSKGVTMVVAAGNSQADACTVSPASEPTALTVAASTSSDARASYSNWGTCVDLFAPGSSIRSAWHTNDTASATSSGTSMASPHAAGAAALVLQADPTALPGAVGNIIRQTATANVITSAGSGTPNLLLNALATSAAAAAAPQTVAFAKMQGTSVKSGKQWRATVSVLVRDVATGAAVPNAEVSGTFSPGAAVKCTTDTSGSCSMTSGDFRLNQTSSTTFTGTGITGTRLQYDSSQNSATQVIIAKP